MASEDVTPPGGEKPAAGGTWWRWTGPEAGERGWWPRTRASVAQAVREAQALWTRRRGSPSVGPDAPVLSPSQESGTAPGAHRTPAGPEGETQPLTIVGAADVPALGHRGWTLPPPDAPAALPNPLVAAWADPNRRLWLVVAALLLVAVVGIILAGPGLQERFAPAPATQPGEAPPVPPGEAPAETPPEAPPAPGLFGATAAQLALAALPLLLGLFWLLSAWLVDVEARRAFVVQEPWGERRTVAYSCLAVGCVFPLILAGLIFSAYGFVSFVLFVANRQSWVAGVQAGALILLVCAVFLIVRGVIARRITERRSQMY